MGLFSFFKKRKKKIELKQQKNAKELLPDDDGQSQFLKDEPSVRERFAASSARSAIVLEAAKNGKTKVYTDGEPKDDEPAVTPGDKVIIQGQKRPISGVYLGNSLSVLKSNKGASKSEKNAEVPKVEEKPVEKTKAAAKVTAAPKVEEKPVEKAKAAAKVTASPKVEEKPVEKAKATAKVAAAPKVEEKSVEKAKAAAKVTAAPKVEEKPVEKAKAAAKVTESSAAESIKTESTKTESSTPELNEKDGAKSGRFVIKKAKDGRYVFNLYAPNHVIVATSQVYTTTGAALNGIKSIVANASKAPIEDQTLKSYTLLNYPKWEMYIDKGGQYRFRLNASNGSCIVHSQGYTTKSNCKNGIESIIRCSANPEIDKSYLKKDK